MSALWAASWSWCWRFWTDILRLVMALDCQRIVENAMFTRISDAPRLNDGSWWVISLLLNRFRDCSIFLREYSIWRPNWRYEVRDYTQNVMPFGILNSGFLVRMYLSILRFSLSVARALPPCLDVKVRYDGHLGSE